MNRGKYSYIENVLLSAVICDAATELTLGNERGLRCVLQMVLSGGNKKQLAGRGKLRKQMRNFMIEKLNSDLILGPLN